MIIRDLKYIRLVRQHLLDPVSPQAAAADLCGMQAQFLSAARHALFIRSGSSSVDGLIKSWTLRGTMHLFPEKDLPLYFRRCGTPEDVIHSDWYRWSVQRGSALEPEREQFFAHLITRAIASGQDTREALRLLCRERGMTEKEEASLFHSWGGVMAELAQSGVIGFKVQEEKACRLLPAFEPMDRHAASLELARRYFTHFGPVTLRDAAYFFRVTQAQVRRWLSELPVETIVIDGQAYYHIPSAVPDGNMPACLLLAGFDQLMLGYRKEDNPFLPPEHLRGIFNTAGIVHAAILLDGRVAGRWKHKDGKLTLTLFEDISANQRRSITDRAESLWTLKKVEWC